MFERITALVMYIRGCSDDHPFAQQLKKLLETPATFRILV